MGLLRIGNFVTETFDADFRTDGEGNVGPSGIQRFGTEGTASPFNYYANFLFQNGMAQPTIPIGQTSYFVFLRTSATTFNHDGLIDLANAGSSSMSSLATTFAPNVPEPSSLALLAAPILALARRRRR